MEVLTAIPWISIRNDYEHHHHRWMIIMIRQQHPAEEEGEVKIP
jgi:hypothetical protein